MDPANPHEPNRRRPADLERPAPRHTIRRGDDTTEGTTVTTILDKIIEHKRHEVAEARSRQPLPDVLSQLKDASPPRGFLAALRRASPPALIAEVKKASPSAGVIRDDFDPVTIASTYEAAGATCLSVLTDEHYFQGHLSFLRDIRQTVAIPVMRKEFIIDRYQIAEARSVGADCVLLIAECLPGNELQQLYDYARELGMDALIELYEPGNVERVLQTGCPLVGVNNRDLRTFNTTLDHTYQIRKLFPPSVLLVSESGIRTHDDICQLRAANVGAVLVGESLMRQPDIGNAVTELMHAAD
jgi:indole-3-glycerol phosphate synthase